MSGVLRASGGVGAPSYFVLTVLTEDVDAMIVDPDHRGRAYGVVVAPCAHPAPLAVVDGALDLFVDVAPGVVHMRYTLALRDPDGGAWRLTGHKDVRRRGWRVWRVSSDTTTLFVTLTRGAPPDGASSGVDAPVYEGVFTMGPGGVLAQLLSFRWAGPWGGVPGLVRYLAYYGRRVREVWTHAAP
jgi:hypothetical protein